MPSRRWLNLAGFLVCVLLLGYALFSQFHSHLEPCPLCIFQRLGVLLVGLIYLAASAQNPGRLGARVYGVLLLLAAAAGASVSLRHIYVQSLPPALAPPCGPGLTYLFQTLPLNQFLQQALTGSADCSVVTWRLLGLTMPEWVLIWFVILGFWGLWLNWRRSAK